MSIVYVRKVLGRGFLRGWWPDTGSLLQRSDRGHHGFWPGDVPGTSKKRGYRSGGPAGMRTKVREEITAAA